MDELQEIDNMNKPTTRRQVQRRINSELRAMVRAIDTRAPVDTLTAINRRLVALRAQRDQMGRAAQ